MGDGLVRPAGEVDELLLEELVAGKLAAALDEVADGRGAEAGEEGRGALLGDNGAAGADHVVALEGVVDLDARLDDVDGRGGLFGRWSATGIAPSIGRRRRRECVRHE